MAENEVLLSVRDLNKHFPIKSGFIFKKSNAYVHAVDGVSFDIYKGETLGLVGESGCGKSTTGRTVLQLHKPTSGSVMFDGKDLAKLKGAELRAVRKDLQMIFQDPYASLNPRMTVGQIIGEPMEIHNTYRGESQKNRIKELLKLVGLNPAFIKARLDRLGSLGLPIKITELDFGDWQKGMYFGEEEQAKRYEMILRIAFSHPAVEGILLWGFWDGRHWVKNGGIVAMDGREKPAGKLIYDLWHKVWTTNGTFTADADGNVKFRGYPGKYKVTVNGKSEMVELK